MTEQNLTHTKKKVVPLLNWPELGALDQFLPDEDIQGEAPPPPEAKPLFDLAKHDCNDLNELLEWRYLCRGGGMLLAGPTGVGKSSLIMQLMISWALCSPALGIRPAMPLRSLLIQAENDEGDLAEMRDGVARGLELTPYMMDHVDEFVKIAHEDSRTGVAFTQEVCRPLIEKHRPDLVWIDPVLAYLGGEANSQKDVGNFLRNLLNPLFREFECGGVLVHHTNKPLTGKEKSNWQAGDFAYLGSGSAEWSNWPRGVLAMRSTGSHSVYELVAAKRGGRLGWMDSEGTTSYSKHIVHSKEPGIIYWREADPSEVPVSYQAKIDPRQAVLDCFPETDCEIPKTTIISLAKKRGIGTNKAREIIKALVEDGSLRTSDKPRKGNRPEILLTRPSIPAPKEQ